MSFSPKSVSLCYFGFHSKTNHIMLCHARCGPAGLLASQMHGISWWACGPLRGPMAHANALMSVVFGCISLTRWSWTFIKWYHVSGCSCNVFTFDLVLFVHKPLRKGSCFGAYLPTKLLILQWMYVNQALSTGLFVGGISLISGWTSCEAHVSA